MNTVVKRSPFQKLMRSWLDWFVAVILGLFFSLMTLGFFSYKPILFLIIIAQLIFFYGMMYCCGQRTAKYDRMKISGVTEFSPKWALTLGIFANALPILTTTLQLFLQLCNVKAFLPFYKLLNIYFMPLLYAINPDSTSGKLNAICYVIIFALCLISIFVVYLTYSLVYKDVDVKALMMYERKK